MANSNSIWALSGPSAGVGNATTETIFTYAVGGANIVMGLPSNGELSNKLLHFKAVARVRPGTSGNGTFNLYGGTTVTSGNKIFSTGTVSCATNCSAVLDGYLHWNNDIDSLMGWQTGIMGATPTLTAAAVATNIYVSDPAPSLAATTSFICAFLFGTSNAANTAFLDEFSVDIA